MRGFAMNAEIIQKPQTPTRETIVKFEQALAQFPQIEIRTEHYFVDGLYAREIHIPAGTVLTGKPHLEHHLNIVSKGRIVVWTEDGMKDVSAGTTIPSRPGCKRVGLALEDTVWVTIHPNPINEQDLEKLEARLIEPIELQQLSHDLGEQLWLG